MRIKGKVIKWHSDRGFGFIAPSTGGEHVFIHKSALCNRHREPKAGDIITFSLGTDKDGRKCAREATFTGEKLKIKIKKNPNSFSLYLSLIFLAAIGVAYLMDKFPANLLLVYLGMSGMTFVAYVIDKHAAKQGTRRTQESTLHMLALVGGWPGAALAQQFLRHKSSKKEFRIGFWMTVLVNLALMIWFNFSKTA